MSYLILSAIILASLCNTVVRVYQNGGSIADLVMLLVEAGGVLTGIVFGLTILSL